MLKVIKRSIPVVAILTVVILGAICDRAVAIQQKTDFVVRVNNSLSLIVPRQDVHLVLNPDSKDLVTDSVFVEVRTNNKNGATVFVSTDKNDGDIRSENSSYYNRGFSDATSLVGRNTKSVIQSITNSFNANSFPSGYWGISFDGETYYGIGSKNKPTSFYSVQSSGQSDIREIRFGAKASDELLSDRYENTVIFTAVATYSPKTTKDIVYMQEIDDEVADSMVPNIQYQLRDMRDNKKYWVSKLADGNIWMTQNLDLELSPTITLTPKDTDISADWTPVRGTIEAAQTTSDTWVNDGTTPYSYGAISLTNRTEVKGYINSADTPEAVEGRYAFPFGTYTTGEECADSVFNSDYCEHYNVGKYYNWAAAIAKNDASAIAESGTSTIIDQSICPAGWRLPIGYADDSNKSKKGEFTILLEAANVASSATFEDGNTEGYYLAKDSNALVNSPLFFTNAGTKSKGQEIVHGYGEYWTSSIYSEPNVDRFAFDRSSESSNNTLKTNFYPSTSNAYADLGVGRSIRCVARNMYTHTLKYFVKNQNIGEQTIKNAVVRQTMIFDPNQYIDASTYIDGKNYISGWNMDSSTTGGCINSGRVLAGDHLDVDQTCSVYAQFTEGQRVDFYGNGGTFDDSSDDNPVILSKMPEKSLGSYNPYEYDSTVGNNVRRRKANKEENVGYYASYNYNSSSYPYYKCYYDTVDLGVFGSSSYVDLDITYQLTGSSDSIYIYEDNDTIWYTSGRTGDITNRTIRVYNNQFRVRMCTNTHNDSNSGNGYGYWIDFLPENGFNHAVMAGSVKIPSRAGYEFLGWSTNSEATTPDFVFDPNHNEYPDNLKLYAVWAETGANYHTLIVSADSKVANVTIKQGSMAGTSINGTRHGNMYVFSNLAEGNQYYLVPEFNSGYEFESWRRVDSATGAALSATNIQNAVYTIGQSDGAVILGGKSGLVAMQGFNCSSLAHIGDSTELVDIRDNAVYTVTKLSDGKCWTTENFHLDFSNLKVDITALNTNNPTPDFVEAANSRVSSQVSWCTQATAACAEKINYATTNIGDFTVDPYGHTYNEYGIYYNWYTATAGHGKYDTNTDIADGDICPAGWHLPSDAEYSGLGNLKYTSYGNNGGTGSHDYWTGAPMNFLHNGYYSNSVISSRGTYGSTNQYDNYGYYWTASNYESNQAYILYVARGYYIGVERSTLDKRYGATVRCVSNDVVDISFNTNGGENQISPVRRIAKGSSYTLSDFVPRRNGYAFTGWNSKIDGTGTRYLPSETFIVPDNNLTLYAQWVGSKGNMKDFNCASLAMKETTALTDTRDGSVYSVAKLADGKCWMTDNLRLNFANLLEDITAENTHNPTAAFMNTANARPAGATSWSNTYDIFQYDTSNLGNYEKDGSGRTYDQRGVYYNWHTATAGHGYQSSRTSHMPGDICPAGWHLPTGDIGSDHGEQYNLLSTGDLRKFPNNYFYSNSDTYGWQWASTALGDCCSYGIEFTTSNPGGRISNVYKYERGAVRCVKD